MYFISRKYKIQIDLWSVAIIRPNYVRHDSATVSAYSVTSAEIADSDADLWFFETVVTEYLIIGPFMLIIPILNSGFTWRHVIDVNIYNRHCLRNTRKNKKTVRQVIDNFFIVADVSRWRF